MKVVVVLSSLYTGGAEYSTLSLYGWLLQRGYEIRLVCIKKASPSYDPKQFGLPEVQYVSGAGFWKRLRSLTNLIREFRPDLVHSVLFEANLLTRFVRLFNARFIHLESLVNEMYSEYRYQDPRVKRWKLEGYRWLDKITQHWGVDHFHANGVSVANHYKSKLGIEEYRITLVPRGRLSNPYLGDQSNREQVRKEMHTGNRLIILHAGRHEFQKGQDVLLDAINQMRDLQDRIKVLLVGREGNFTSVIKEKIKKYSLDACVVMTGHRNDLSSLLAATDVFVFPSRFEGLPGVLIEAEAAGLPIVCSDIDNNKEVVEAGVNALLFPTNNPEVLAESLVKLIHDPVLREAMGSKSLGIYKNKFTLNIVHEKMRSLLESLMKN